MARVADSAIAATRLEILGLLSPAPGPRWPRAGSMGDDMNEPAS
jgi:hypothetical protein